MSFDLNSLLRTYVVGLQPYTSARDEFDTQTESYVYLDANENPYPNGVNRYPDPQQKELKKILAQKLEVGADQLLLGNGSDEVLDLVFRAFCEPNQDEILIMPPTYGMYKVLAEINQITLNKVPLDIDFQIDMKSLFKAINPKTKAIFLCSPNNPSGNSFQPNDIEDLLKAFNGIVVIDEAYIDFSEQNSWATRLDDFPNLIVSRTLSKAYGMAGLRLGICIASREIISALNKIKPPYNINTLTQERALEELAQSDNYMKQVDILLEERSILSKKLQSIGFVEYVYPSDANFLLVRVDNADVRYSQLIQAGVVVRNRSKEYGCVNCLRFTVGTPEENKKLIQSLSNIDL
ncbi:MAG: histidinol-phosphate transaminase [Flavobacteriaceae bacterium]|nr:histidinol-phosphate transaminase [Flavobacteriaceae bacterium]